MRYTSLLATFIFLIAFHSLAQQSGDLDSSFNGNGIVTSILQPPIDEAKGYAMAIQTDGKILVSGQANSTVTGSNLILCRYNINGTPDTTFGVNGIVADSNWINGNFLAIQQDNKILVGGFNARFSCMRFNPNGSVDTSFGQSGVFICSFPGYDLPYQTCGVLQPDGKIVLSGWVVDFSGNDALALVRLDTTGTFDPTFGNMGVSITNFDIFHIGRSVAIQPDGKLVVAATFNGLTSLSAIRFKSNGEVDSTFGTLGVASVTIHDSTDVCYSIIILPDGKFILGGSTKDGNNDDFALVRINTNGSIDSSFGNNGIVITDFGGQFGHCTSLSINSTGTKIIAAGIIYISSYNFALASYNIDGSLDTTFGAGGKVINDLNNNYSEDKAYACAFQTDGKILVAGYTTTPVFYVVAVTRYLTSFYLGVVTFDASPQFMVYPNPIPKSAELRYILQEDEVLSLSIYDLYGKLLSDVFTNEPRLKGEQTEEINLNENLVSGYYNLVLSSKSRKVVVKICKL